jgi:hypothetical protein
MNWWNRNKKIVLIISGGLLALIAVVVFFLMASGPVVSDQFCTLMGCVGDLNIEIAGLTANTPFEVSVVYPSGETQTLTCGTEAEQAEPFVSSCSPTGAFFSLTPDVEPPQEITVIVTIDGKQTSEVIQPAYEKFQPNGEDCPPVCYTAKILFNLAQ